MVQHPATHLPALSNDIVLPLSGRYRHLDGFDESLGLRPGDTLPTLVATSFTCDAITALGLTSSLITYAAYALA
jgi:hypothetical protein